MPSSGMLLIVALVRTDVIYALMMVATHSSETSVLTRATSRDIPEDGILIFESSFQNHTVLVCLRINLYSHIREILAINLPAYPLS
jgi:hypothetical protein